MSEKTPSIKNLSAQEKRALLAKLLKEKASKTAQEYPLSYNQWAMWFLYTLSPETTAYNVAFTARILSELDINSLKRAFQALVERHAPLRTTYTTKNDEAIQVVHPHQDVAFEQIDASGWTEVVLAQQVEQAHRQPFDLELGPVMRVSVFSQAANRHVLLISAHHIAIDGWSLWLLLDELRSLYAAYTSGQLVTLPAIDKTYIDYVDWQAKMVNGAEGEAHLNFWKEQLDGDIPIMEIPTDYPRPAIQTYRGQTLAFSVDEDLSQKIKALARAQGVTLYMLLLAALKILLYRYTGQTEVLVGSPVAGRNQAQWVKLVGCFINSVVLKTHLTESKSFTDFLQDVRYTVINTLAHQEYPLQLLAKHLQVHRDASQSPMVQVDFVLQKPQQYSDLTRLFSVTEDSKSHIDFGGLQLEYYPVTQQEGQLDITLEMMDGETALMGDIKYNTDLFEEATITRMISHFKTLLAGIAANPEQSIATLPILSPQEKEQILGEWNQTTLSDPRQQQCAHHLFEAQAADTPDAIAVVIPATDAGTDRQTLTYVQLNQRANQLAHYLQKRGIGPEKVVGICVERSLEMVVGVLGVLKAGGAYLPLDPMYPAERLAFALTDSRAEILLTQQALADRFAQMSLPAISLDADWPTIGAEPHTNPPGTVGPENLVYVTYTSGSTGQAKGVMIEHHSLVNAYLGWETAYNLKSLSAHLQMANFPFDVFAGDLVRALCSGGSLTICPRELLLAPQQLLSLMRREQIDCAEFVPAVLRPLVKHLRETGQTLDFMSVVACGSDSWYVAEYTAFYAVCGPNTRLINSFGVTEATIDSTYFEGPVGQMSQDRLVPIGRPFANTKLYILDLHLQPTPVGVPGELYIGGPNVARGYINRNEQNTERFIANLFDGNTPNARLYKTGDKARYLPDGNIEFLGRMDDQVKIRGFRVELGEVEALLGQHRAVVEAVVVARSDNSGEKRLTAYVVPNPIQFPSPRELRGFLQKRLPDYMIPAHFVLLDAMPLSANGKVNRKALPEPDAGASALDTVFVAPETQLQELLAGVWADVLGLEKVSIKDNFFELGGHSLLATQVISRLRRALHTELPLRTLFEYPTVAAMATAIESQQKQVAIDAPPLTPYPREKPPRLSFSQERMWFIHQLAPESTAYNIPSCVRIQGELDLTVLEQTFGLIIERHEVLRTTFPLVGGEPVQLVAPAGPVTLPIIDLQLLPPTEQDDEVKRIVEAATREAFDLVNGPVLRVSLIKLGQNDHILFSSMHHIVSDQWSGGIFTHEFTEIYNALCDGTPIPLNDLSVQYADYSLWQRDWLKGEVLQAKLAFWKAQLEGLSVLDLPTDFPRPAIQTYNGSYEKFPLSPSIIDAIRKLCRQEQVTPFMFMLAIFKTLLLRYTGQQDIAVGTPIANRNWLETEQLLGTFVNTVVLRSQAEGNPTFKDFLRHIRNRSLDAFAHQDFPFEKLVEELQPERDMSHTPLVQVLFNVQNAPVDMPRLRNDLLLTPVWLESGAAQFDLTLSVSTDIMPNMVLNYNTDLFKQDTAKRMLGHLEMLISNVLADPDKCLLDIPMLTEAEREQQLIAWNQTGFDYPQHVCIHQLIETQAAKTPDAAAVMFNDRSLTYRELNERANQLAHHLQSLGVTAETPVGISMERCTEMVVGLLGILKAGGTYLPLDPLFPQDRLAYMIEDSHTKIVITQQHLPNQSITESDIQLVCLDSDWDTIARQPVDPPTNPAQAHNLAYIIYTSGSTGKPKGVQLSHQNAVNFLCSMQHQPGLTAVDKLFAVTTLSFDISVLEVFLPLITGAQVIIAPGEIIYDGQAMIRHLAHNRPTVMQATPATWRMLIEAGWPGDPKLKVLCGGEAMPQDLAHWLVAHTGEVWNMYGPTETAVWSTIYQITENTDHITIGRPIANTQIYMLDKNMEPTPIGVAGELFIAGDGVARGYLNRAELNAEKFVPDPFSPKPNAKMYRTGDQARYLADGQIEFLGRIDFQVKVRGFRIELGEIEAVLTSHPAVKQAVVIVREDTPGDKRLVAYHIPETTGTSPDIADLRAYMRASLPEYMVPSFIVKMDEYPMTPNRKINRKALPAPTDTGSLSGRKNIIAPRTPTEETLFHIWREVLGVNEISIHDNFFELGGHSLLATLVISRLREESGVDLPLRNLFLTPTLTAVADAVDTLRWAVQGAPVSFLATDGEREELEL